ncbi:hypothetical protein BSR28_04910 [Boudabousia liubingyangii]|uniref:ABC transporter ATP-binding protein n=1 Tax=Boudabousia liubingyangii TaxID=1921764 RepID=UPI00093C281B|nr:ABC transporter ATP-binding protein [Boudabousia liubingyangii]OKL46783.1 hypothetical protein BSR28_04910 [Boudabousia liubingyangii]
MNTKAETLALEMRDVTKVFPTKNGPLTAVNHLNLEVPAGQKVALLGSNGAGKSTSFEMILDLLPMTSGQIRIFGQSPKQAQAQRLIGSLLQSGGLLPNWTVKETLTALAALTGNESRVPDVTKAAGIEQFLSQRIRSCSGGQIQRLRLALALINQGKLLILDEPTAGMDPHARRDFWQQINNANQDGRTVIYATHFLDEAAHYADRILVMHRGLLLADGTHQELLSQTGTKTLEEAFFALTDRAEEHLKNQAEKQLTEVEGKPAETQTSAASLPAEGTQNA